MDRPFNLGDRVTRDGSDVHVIVEDVSEYGAFVVECVVEPASGWIKVGERELNLIDRYRPLP